MGFSATDLTLEMGVRLYGAEFIKAPPVLSAVSNRGGWWPYVREPYTGAWQQNESWTVDTVVSHPTVYSCVTIIANDIGKLRPKLIEQVKEGGIWSETTSPAFSPVLRRPNRYQNYIQFQQWWIMCKLLRGNTYALKERDGRGIVVAEYLLDPGRVTPLVAPDGSVYYQLNTDNLAGLQEAITVPASEIIHDRMNCLFHPLVGVSPLFAAGTSATIAQKIEGNSAYFFGNGSNPGGVLTAPGNIPQETADRLKAVWDEKFGGVNSGRVAVLGDGLTFEPMRMSAVESQLIETLKWADEKICSVYHVPAYKVGVGPPPAYNNIGALQQDYYSTCLQTLIEEYEACQDEGLGLDVKIEGRNMGVELDLRGLIRMDPAGQIATAVSALGGGITTTNETRADFDLAPVEGGDVIFRQQQDFPLSVLADRDIPGPVVAPAIKPVQPTDNPAAPSSAEAAKQLGEWFTRAMDAARTEVDA
jgi:HK97 family phage portal protein